MPRRGVRGGTGPLRTRPQPTDTFDSGVVRGFSTCGGLLIGGASTMIRPARRHHPCHTPAPGQSLTGPVRASCSSAPGRHAVVLGRPGDTPHLFSFTQAAVALVAGDHRPSDSESNPLVCAGRYSTVPAICSFAERDRLSVLNICHHEPPQCGDKMGVDLEEVAMRFLRPRATWAPHHATLLRRDVHRCPVGSA
jgi:hypothetical protein